MTKNHNRPSPTEATGGFTLKSLSIALAALAVGHFGFWSVRYMLVGMDHCTAMRADPILHKCHPAFDIEYATTECAPREFGFAVVEGDRWFRAQHDCKMPGIWTPLTDWWKSRPDERVEEDAEGP
ncbi:MAG: hypothetical protein AAGJ50_03750 [Pseudomonadota bacterium]